MGESQYTDNGGYRLTPQTFAIAALLSLLPISELRGAIPYALAHGVPPAIAYVYCVALNALVGPFVFLFLSTVHRLMFRIAWYRRVFGRLIERARHRVEKKVARYGYLGIVLFVAIPLPVTGAYTGSLGAWVLGLDRGKTYLAVAIGVVLAGLVVSIVAYFGIGALSLFIKRPL
jgi:uncharacterized membrane protein